MSVPRMLKGHDLFQALPVEEVDRISGFSSVKSCEQGYRLFEHDAPATHVFLLLEGQVYLRLPANQPDVSIVVDRVEQGELFGLSPLLGSPRYTALAHCPSPAQVLAIEAKPFREMLQRNHHVGFHIMGQVAQIYFGRYIDILKNLQAVTSQIPLIR